MRADLRSCCRSFCLMVSVLFLAGAAAHAQPGLDERPANPICVAPERPGGSTLLDVEVVASQDISWPVEMLQHPTDSSTWYVVDRSGYVAVYKDGPTFTRTGTLIDISSMVQRELGGRAWNELGLLGMALHPNFANNGEFFLYFSADGTEGTVLEGRLSRFTSQDGGKTASPSTEDVVLRFKRDKQWHWGGRPTFGPDGYLYMTTGDGGTHRQSQDLNNINGKMLRIDVDGGDPYAIPPDNPFAGGGGLPEIYAYGFRNPWRWSFDSLTGDIWEGDVGPSEREEINRIIKGGNYGWSLFQGTLCQFSDTCDDTGLERPVFEYTHDTSLEISGFAVIGGYVYRGSEMPELYGNYIFADTMGKIIGFDPAAVDATAALYADIGNTILSIAESPTTGELYVLSPGAITRIVSTGVGEASDFPERLSESGCVNNGNPRQPSTGLIPYDINAPLWSDGAAKQRWIGVPDSEKVEINSEGDFVFPVGTVLVKEFALGGKRIETRWMVRHSDGQWAGYSFEWNDAETDATLVPPEGKVKMINGQNWLYPSRTQCLSCHTAVSGRSLGPEIAQLNGLGYYPSTDRTENQLETLEHIGMFTAPLPDVPANLDKLPNISDTSASLEDRSRAYLHSNCAFCHRPDGPGQGPEDFRYWLPSSQIGAINVDPTQGTLGLTDAKLIKPGDPDNSVMLQRMKTLDTVNRMPPLSSELEDTEATAVVASWIQSMSSASDTVNITNTFHDPVAETFWLAATSSQAGSATLEAFQKNAGVMSPLGPLKWKPAQARYAGLFQGVDRLPDCVVVSSSGGGFDELELAGSCTSGQQERPLEEWGAPGGGVTVNGNKVMYSGTPTGWKGNTVNSAGLSQIGAADAFEVRFRIDTNPSSGTWVVGLGMTESGSTWRDVDFALRNSEGTLQIYESGTWRTSGPALAKEDVMSIAVDSNVIEYRLNDAVVYSTTAPVGAEYYVDTSFKNGSVALSVSVVSDFGSSNVIPVYNWLGGTGGVSDAGNSISYSGSPTGWSANTINSAPLSLMGATASYTISWSVGSNPAGTTWVVGLGVAETGANWRDIDYGFRSSSGALEIREAGTWIASIGTLAIDDVLTMAVMGSTLEYRLNGIPLHSRSIAGDEDFYIDSSFNSGGITLENVVIGTN